MENMKITAKIETCGFKPSEIRPRKMWTKLQEDFLELYNDYVEFTNDRIPALNEAWTTLNPKTEEEEKETLTPEEQEIKDQKDLNEKLMYGLFMRDNFDGCAFLANQKHPDSYLSGYVMMDGDIPIFAARIKQHPECTMTFVIEK